MKKDHLICDGEEIIAKVIRYASARVGSWSMQTLTPGEARGVRQVDIWSTWTPVRIHHDEIRSIRVESTRRKLLGLISVGDEQIVIEKKSGEKVAIPRHREAYRFDSYIERLREFCDRYKITFSTEDNSAK